MFETATPVDTPRLMTELVTWVNEEREAARLHPLLIIALCIVMFLELHPFQDGNGRLSRVLAERGTRSQHGSGRGVWYDLR